MRILIVDDEQYICEQIETILSGIPLPPGSGTESALDGLSALHLALNRIPDLLICDIRMPGLNGSELAEQILELNKQCAVIILSHYGDPDYLRSAISLHVKAYLDKPVVPEKLRRAVLDVISEQSAYSRQQEVYHNALSHIQDLLKKLWCLELFKKNPSYEELIARCRQYHFEELIDSVWRCVYLRIISARMGSELFLPEQVHMLTRGHSETGGTYCFLYAARPELLSQQQLELFFSGLLENGLCDGMAAGELVTDRMTAFSSFQQARLEAGRLFFEDEPRLMIGKHVPPAKIYPLPESVIRDIQNSLLSFDFQSAHNCFLSLFAELRTCPDTPVSSIREFFQRMADMFLHVSEKNQLVFHRHHMNTDLYRDILRADRFSALQAMMEEWFRELTDFGEGDSRVIRSITACIRQNYQDPAFGNRDISLFTGYTVPYLCTLFKRSTGITINSYINQIRMEHACRLLTETDESIEKIAMAVGFSSAKNFNRNFKSHMLMSPGQYRKQNS